MTAKADLDRANADLDRINDDLNRSDAVDLVLIHAIACSTVLFPGLVPQDVLDTMGEYSRDLAEECGEDLVPMTVAAMRLLANVSDDVDDTICNEPPAETDPPPPGYAYFENLISDLEAVAIGGRSPKHG